MNPTQQLPVATTHPFGFLPAGVTCWAGGSLAAFMPAAWASWHQMAFELAREQIRQAERRTRLSGLVTPSLN